MKGGLLLLAAGVAGWYLLVRTTGPRRTAVMPGAQPSLLDQLSDSVSGFFSTVSVDNSMSYDTAYRLRGKNYEAIIAAAEVKHGIPTGLLMRQAWAESSFDPNAVNSYSGAQGMFQFMPETAAWLKVDPFDVRSAADGAGRYMKYLYGRFNSWPLALAAYNWGEGNLSKALAGTRTPPKETTDYVAKIMGTDLVALIDQRRGGVAV